MTVETVQIATECLLPSIAILPSKKTGVKKNLFGGPNRRETRKLYEQVMQQENDRLCQYQITGVIGIFKNKEKITSHEIEPTPPPSEDEEENSHLKLEYVVIPEAEITPVISQKPERTVPDTKSGKSKLKINRVIAPYNTLPKSKQKTIKEFYPTKKH